MSLYHRYKDRFGTAGVVLGVIAIVLAIGGSAIAASGLNGKQKKEVKGIAKSFQGTGPAGLPGAAGTNGTNGKDGTNGTPGAAGTPGKSVVTATLNPGQGTPPCEEGGVSIEVEGSGTKKQVCNGEEGEEGEKGEEGSPWTAGGTLPPSSAAGCPCTETGAWAAEGTSLLATASFSIPLAAPLDESHVVTIAEGATAPVECDDGAAPAPSPEHPEADSGYLCIFQAGGEGSFITVTRADSNSILSNAGAATTGANILISGGNSNHGTFAVTG